MDTTQDAHQDGRRERSEATRGRLLRAAGGLFAERGYAGTTLDAIEEKADAHRALVRYHFGSKKGLYSAVLHEMIAVGVELLEPVRKSRGSAVRRLAAFIDAIAELNARRPHFGPIIVREWMSGGAHMEPDVMASFLSFFQIDREILEEGQSAGEFCDVDPHSVHLALVGSLVFFQISQPMRERRAAELSVPELDRSLFTEQVKSLFLRGLQR